MKKKIFIHIPYLEIGGAEISLIGLLNSVDYSKYGVDLFISKHSGELMQLIPPVVKVFPENVKYSMILSPIKCAIRQAWSIAFARLLAKFRCKIWRLNRCNDKEDYSIFQYVAKYTSPILPQISNQEYDLAISFLTPHNICLEKVIAKRKVAWIHTDYSTISVNAELEFPIWKAYDKIISISDDVTTSFLKVFPSLSDKIVKIENILSPQFVRQRAELFTVDDEMPRVDGWVNLLSVGRFCYAKNYDNVPDICRRLIELGCDVRWYIIGYGGEEELIQQRIIEARMEDRVVILGKKTNPYPYIKACDIYVQPSRYEGKSVTVREAQMLCKPVVITNYATASSQIKDGIDGVIVPMDNEDCAVGIKSLIDNREKQKELSYFLSKNDYGNEKEVEKLYDLI